jgi:hypothetical protein
MLVAPDAYVRNEAVSRARIRVDWGSGVTFGHHGGCCIFGFLSFQVLLLAGLVYGTPVQAG